jgi:hypothetical protein
MEGFMRVKVFLLALCACALGAAPSTSANAGTGEHASLLQRNSDVSAATKRKPARPSPQGNPSFRRAGPADPSFGPDGRPYPVPEYLRGQCYIDDGYGRFSACNNRN